MKPQNRQHPIGQIVCYILLIFLALITVIPFLWMLSASLKLNKDVFTWPMKWIPEVPQWKNYLDIWTKVPMLVFIKNTGLGLYRGGLSVAATRGQYNGNKHQKQRYSLHC